MFSAISSAHVDKILGDLQNISAEEMPPAPDAEDKTMIVILLAH